MSEVPLYQTPSGQSTAGLFVRRSLLDYGEVRGASSALVVPLPVYKRCQNTCEKRDFASSTTTNAPAPPCPPRFLLRCAPIPPPSTTDPAAPPGVVTLPGIHHRNSVPPSPPSVAIPTGFERTRSRRRVPHHSKRHPWTLELSSKRNLPHAINFRASCGANLAMLPPRSGGPRTLAVPRRDCGMPPWWHGGRVRTGSGRARLGREHKSFTRVPRA